ncbi:MAG: RNA-binding protein [Niastella sp.]|nr:RNA-binding protein [Niastella sp.]
MIQAGEYYNLKIMRLADPGAYLDDGKDGVLLPNRFVPPGANIGDELRVFIYHDSEDRPIATTQNPKGTVGEIVKLVAVSVTPQGAFLDWGLMKDIFVPRSQQISLMRTQGAYLVKIYVDEKTGRVAATERFEQDLNNENLDVKEMDEVQLTVLRRTDIGYLMIINNKYTGVLHFNEIYRNITAGDQFKGYIKKIYEDNKIDVVAGTAGYKRVEDESEKIIRLLKEHDGYLPYHDKSNPDDIYDFFGMSKKTFKMTIGALYKQRKIELVKTGIKLLE